MRKLRSILTIGMIIVIVGLVVVNIIKWGSTPICVEPPKTELQIDTISRWDLMWQAISWRESRDNPNAKNKNSTASGQYQILKQTVDDANRIAGFTKYQYNDRFSPELSRQMLNDIHAHYNPNNCIDRSIRLHRIGFATDSISVAVFEAYKKDMFDVSIIAHEATHAALEIFDYIGTEQGLFAHQEPLCYLVGYIANCIVKARDYKAPKHLIAQAVKE